VKISGADTATATDPSPSLEFPTFDETVQGSQGGSSDVSDLTTTTGFLGEDDRDDHDHEERELGEFLMETFDATNDPLVLLEHDDLELDALCMV
jgi:hypothetical protein